jgi:hypothetical protein
VHLSQWESVIPIVGKILAGPDETDTRQAGTTLPGTEQGVPRQPGATTTVSPAIQAQISPQISPTMVQQQDSPGATVGSSPQQYMPGGLAAETGVSPYGGYGAPGYPGVSPGISPYQPYAGAPGAYYPVGATSPSITQQGPSLPPWLLPVALVGGAVGLAIFMRRKKRAS